MSSLATLHGLRRSALFSGRLHAGKGALAGWVMRFLAVAGPVGDLSGGGTSTASTSVSRIAVVHYVGATQKSRSVVASLVADFRQQEHDVTVLDIGRFGTVFQDFPPEWAVRLAGHTTYRQRFIEVIESVGADLTVLDPHQTPTITPPESRQAECSQAIESELLTYFRQKLSTTTSAISAG